MKWLVRQLQERGLWDSFQTMCRRGLGYDAELTWLRRRGLYVQTTTLSELKRAYGLTGHTVRPLGRRKHLYRAHPKKGPAPSIFAPRI